MIDALPAPPIDAEVDLTDFPFMPLEVRRLRDSKLASASKGEAFRCAVLLWCAAWHQLPAGSLPDDDVELSQLAGYGRAVKTWRKLRESSLYGWKKCSDGRLYHSVVVEKANEAWRSKLAEAHRREVDRLRKENKRREENQEPKLRIPSLEEWNAARRGNGIPSESAPVPSDAQRNSGARPTDSLLKGEGRERERDTHPRAPARAYAHTREDGGGESAPHEAWREVGCDVQAYEGWLEWRASENDQVPPRVRIEEAKFLGGKGTPDHQRAFVEKIIRYRFKRMHDPIEPKAAASNGQQHSKPTPERQAADLRELMDSRPARDLEDFRDPHPHESPDAYRTALRIAESERGQKLGAPRFPTKQGVP